MNSNHKINRLAIAKMKGNLNKILVVQIRYYLNNKNIILDKSNEFEVLSVNGTVRYIIRRVLYKKKKIIFIYGGSDYLLDLNGSLFEKINF